jgi:enamine deaminase RidA (YjgF/YER057c/UK114 family)
MTAVRTPVRRLVKLDIVLPDVVHPAGSYAPATRSEGHVYTSGQVPLRAGRLMATGRLGADVSVEQGYACARQSALNLLAALRGVADLDTVLLCSK